MDMIRINLKTTHNDGAPGEITGEPMRKADALNTLAELYGFTHELMSAGTWEYNAYNGGVWTFSLVKA